MNNEQEFEYITSPKGKKAKLKELKVGKIYLYKGLYKYRLIIHIFENGKIAYHDGIGPGVCTPAHFITMCPYEATNEEVEIIDNKWRKWKNYKTLEEIKEEINNS